ncbi:MAG TPA: hypothetical protein VMR45_01620 [Patescibacteria group bacterium]|nr:hypothetical protein [Patescibacteria group bacterium]
MLSHGGTTEQPTIGYSEFRRELDRQQVALDDELCQRANLSNISRGVPTPMACLIKSAGYRVRRNPDIQLATGIIDTPPHWQTDPYVRTLVGFLNIQHQPPDPKQFAANINTNEMSPAVGNCGEAEINFGITLDRMRRIGLAQENVDEQSVWSALGNCQVLLGSDGQPVAYTKDEGEESMLVLRPLLMGGIPVPPGYLITVTACSHPIIRPECVVAASLLRLSAYGLQPCNRGRYLYPKDYYSYAPRAYSIAKELPLSVVASRVGAVATAVGRYGYVCDASCNPRRRMAPSEPQEVQVITASTAAASGEMYSMGAVADSIERSVADLLIATTSIRESVASIESRVAQLESKLTSDGNQQTDEQICALRQALSCLGSAGAIMTDGRTSAVNCLTRYVSHVRG